MSTPHREEIPGIHLPYNQIPKLFRVDDLYEKAQGKYLDACQIFFLEPSPTTANNLRYRTDIFMTRFRSVARTIITSETDGLKVLDDLQGVIVTSDTKNKGFLRGLTTDDEAFPLYQTRAMALENGFCRKLLMQKMTL